MTQDIPFLLESDYGSGHQPQAIQELVQGVEEQRNTRFAGHHRFRKDLHHGQCHPGTAAPVSGDRP